MQRIHHTFTRLISLALLGGLAACSIPGLDKIGLTGEDGLIRDRVGDYRDTPRRHACAGMAFGARFLVAA